MHQRGCTCCIGQMGQSHAKDRQIRLQDRSRYLGIRVCYTPLHLICYNVRKCEQLLWLPAAATARSCCSCWCCRHLRGGAYVSGFCKGTMPLFQ